jgi:hypothetical protein
MHDPIRLRKGFGGHMRERSGCFTPLEERFQQGRGMFISFFKHNLAMMRLGARPEFRLKL